MITLRDVRESTIINIAGVSRESDEFAQLVNEAQQRLLKRGDWEGIVVPIYTCTTDSCVVWPRYVDHVRQLNYCNRIHVPIKNMWWDFMPFDRYMGLASQPWGAGPRWYGPRGSMVMQGRSPVFQDIQGDARYIRVYPESAQDANKTVTIFGVDNNGQPLMTKGAGPWKEGLTLSIQAPYVQSPVYIRKIDRVVKDVTTGPIRLYAYNTSTSLLEDVAYYEPSETNPSYERSRLCLPCFNTDSNRSVVALVKLKHVPIKVDTDLVLIDNLQALKYAIQAIKFDEANDFQNGRASLMFAVDELNNQLKDANPEWQVPAEFGELGQNQHTLGFQRCF